jgi:hypothetical protein
MIRSISSAGGFFGAARVWQTASKSAGCTDLNRTAYGLQLDGKSGLCLLAEDPTGQTFIQHGDFAVVLGDLPAGLCEFAIRRVSLHQDQIHEFGVVHSSTAELINLLEQLNQLSGEAHRSSGPAA